MAAVAGLLGVQLTKKDAYALGDPSHELTTRSVLQTWQMILLAAILLLAVMMVVFVTFASFNGRENGVYSFFMSAHHGKEFAPI